VEVAKLAKHYIEAAIPRLVTWAVYLEVEFSVGVLRTCDYVAAVVMWRGCCYCLDDRAIIQVQHKGFYIQLMYVGGAVQRPRDCPSPAMSLISADSPGLSRLLL
jgi:hypothetical protein